MDGKQLWQRYSEYLCDCPTLGIALDVSRVPFPAGFLKKMEPALQAAELQVEWIDPREAILGNF